MNKKQIVGLVAAALVFVFVGVTSAVTAKVTADKTSVDKSETAALDKLTGSYTLPPTDFVAALPVEGTIASDSSGSSLFSQVTYDHEWTMGYVDSLMNSSANKAILLEVNSPGGTVYASDELYQKLLEYKEKTGRPVYTYMKEEACSGGYYISMASDEIYANRNCWTGSIGVIIQLTNLKGLYDKYGIKEENIVSGANKAMGSSGSDLTDAQRQILQSLVDESYEQFTGIVAEGRKMDIAAVKKLADGRIYSALQAKENGLIDTIMGYEEAQADIADQLGNPDIDFYEPDSSLSSFWSSLLGSAQSLVPKSDTQAIQELLDGKESGVLMYYAKLGE